MDFDVTTLRPPGEQLAAPADTNVQNGNSAGPPVSLLSGMRNLAWLGVQNFPELRYVVPGLIPEGSAILVGPPKIGKSFLVLGIGIAAACGGTALSAIHTGAPRPVFYLALEDGDRRLQDRGRKILGDCPWPPAFDYLTTVSPGLVVPTIAEWLQRHGDAQPLIILDTLGKAMPLAQNGESSYQRDYRIGSELKALVDACPGAALLTNHHDRKAASADFVENVSGTNALAGAADTIIVITRNRNEPEGLIQVTGRDVAEGAYAVRFDGSLWALDGKDLAEASGRAEDRCAIRTLSDRSSEVLGYVNGQDGAVSASNAAKALLMDGDTCGKYLRRLAESGRISKIGRGAYMSVRSVRTAGFGHSDTSDTPLDDGWDDSWLESER